MLFNTIEFVVFLPLVVLLYFLLTDKTRLWFLLLASYYFYIYWRWEYLLLILAQTEINFAAALSIGKAKSVTRKKAFLAFSTVATLAILFFFKYFNFAASSARSVFALCGWNVHVPRLDFLLPVGISFHTFQTLAYTFDVYRGKLSPETQFSKFALFVSFFPILVAGPIERGGNLLPQFDAKRELKYENWALGLRLILWGLIKKMVIADRVGTAVAGVYANPTAFPGPLLILGTFFFAVQIYCDFSGYSDIAIGAARLMGFQLMTNFKMPYFSISLSEFWQRWHISLSTWFRDYVYFPMGGNRVSRPRWCLNILAVFCLSGLWHGASWTFVIWGAIHGTWLILERALAPAAAFLANGLRLRQDGKVLGLARWSLVFLIVLCSWVFFKASSVPQALNVLSGFFHWHKPTLAQTLAMGLPVFELGLAFAGIALLVCVDIACFWQPRIVCRLWSQRPLRWALYLAGFYGLVFFGVLGRVEFIYFQF